MSPSPSPIFPDDLIVEILSWLTVKPLLKMKCVSKSWNSFISDSKFVRMHLNRSARHSQSYLVSYKESKHDGDDSFIPFSLSGLMNDRSITLPNDPHYQLIGEDCRHVVGSCNGLVCLLGYSPHAEENDVYEHEENDEDEHEDDEDDYEDDEDEDEDKHEDDEENNNNKVTWLRFWNPATMTISDKLGYFRDDMYQLKSWKFIFGYVNSTDTYKIVALYSGSNMTTEVRVLSFGNNIWRNIQSFPAHLLQLSFYSSSRVYGGVHLNCTVNWLAIIQNGNLALQYVIISLDLGTETYTQFLPPPGSLEELSPIRLGSVKVSRARPGVCVLKDSLCFYHDSNKTDLIIWKMTRFGDESSWTQFLRFGYNNLQMNLKRGFLIFNLYENGDTLVCAHDRQARAYLYNWRNNRVVKTRVNQKICWFSINHYVESLVATS